MHIVAIRNLRELYLLKASPPLLVKLILELTQLSTAVCSKTIEVATLRQSKCVSLTAGNGNYLLV